MYMRDGRDGWADPPMVSPGPPGMPAGYMWSMPPGMHAPPYHPVQPMPAPVYQMPVSYPVMMPDAPRAPWDPRHGQGQSRGQPSLGSGGPRSPHEAGEVQVRTKPLRNLGSGGTAGGLRRQRATSGATGPLPWGGKPGNVLQDSRWCNVVTKDIEEGDGKRALEWMMPDLLQVSLSERGCHVVQRLLDVVNTNSCASMLKVLAPHTAVLSESKYGNHVLCKLIEVSPCPGLTAIIDVMYEIGAPRFARHNFASRVLQRLIENCSEQQIAPLVDQITEDIRKLTTHNMGNYIVKSVFQHGGDERRAQILAELESMIPQMATHRMGSPVIQSFFTHGGPEVQQLVSEWLVRSESPSLADMAANRYGSYVVEELPSLVFPGSEEMMEVARNRLRNATPQQMASTFFPRAAETIGCNLGLPPARLSGPS